MLGGEKGESPIALTISVIGKEYGKAGNELAIRCSEVCSFTALFMNEKEGRGNVICKPTKEPLCNILNRRLIPQIAIPVTVDWLR